MSDSIIRVLPEHLANQIAAGEVVQRPSSVVKELLENALDAEASRIELIVEEAGRALIQLVDDGMGMSPEDLEMAFERHATSKLSRADDLFALRTMGFRGEALASIASVASIEADSRRIQDEAGCFLKIEGGKKTDQGSVARAVGTSIKVRNLFFNVPARRAFLKSDAVEFRHIGDEFNRVALSRPDRAFRLYHNKHIVHSLDPSGLRMRISQLFGTAKDEQLVPVEETTDWVSISGFVGKPQTAKRSRGEQFLFVNKRFVKSSVVHSAIASAFEGLLADGYFPAYFLFLEIEPSKIDVNIHPTKTEIKFEDDASVFRLVRVSVRHALGRNNIAPSIDFELDANSFPSLAPGSPRPVAPNIRVNPNFNPFSEPQSPAPAQAMRYATEPEPYFENGRLWSADETRASRALLRIGEFVFFERNNSLCALEPARIFFERTFRTEMSRWEGGSILSQQLLYPQELPFRAADLDRLAEMLPGLRMLGYDIDLDPKQGAVMQGTPTGIEAHEAAEFLELWLDEPLHEPDSERLWFGRKLALAQRKSASMHFGNSELELSELMRVLESWNWCERDALGRRMWVQFEPGEISEQFEK